MARTRTNRNKTHGALPSLIHYYYLVPLQCADAMSESTVLESGHTRGIPIQMRRRGGQHLYDAVRKVGKSKACLWRGMCTLVCALRVCLEI